MTLQKALIYFDDDIGGNQSRMAGSGHYLIPPSTDQ